MFVLFILCLLRTHNTEFLLKPDNILTRLLTSELRGKHVCRIEMNKNRKIVCGTDRECLDLFTSTHHLVRTEVHAEDWGKWRFLFCYLIIHVRCVTRVQAGEAACTQTAKLLCTNVREWGTQLLSDQLSPVVIVMEGSKSSSLIAPPDCECVWERESQTEGRKQRHRVAQQWWRDRLFAAISVFIGRLVLLCRRGLLETFHHFLSLSYNLDYLPEFSACILNGKMLMLCDMCARCVWDGNQRVMISMLTWRLTVWLNAWDLCQAEGHIAGLTKGPMPW